MTKYVFVTGGVVSGIGKGIIAASLGRLLKMRGFKIQVEKFDPYLNVDPGTMNPNEHGEVFVTDDGVETDLDLGHYERMIDISLNKFSNLTSGKVLWSVLNKERNGEFLGKTVQIIPHVTNEIKSFIRQNVENTKPDVLITEIGGTIGDIESQSFIEAIRQFSLEVGLENCLFIHVCLVPFISGSDEYKTKPTQHSVKELQGMGIRPDIIIARSDTAIDESLIKKIAMFCNVKEDCVINDITLDDLYFCPNFLHDKGFDEVVVRELNLPATKIDFADWDKMLKKIKNRSGNVTIAIVGKYCKLRDSYISIVEALNHAGCENGVFVNIKWIESEDIKSEEDAKDQLLDVQGVLVPGGFGSRGIEGKIIACKVARENKIPYFGICLGMQIAVIEFARNVAGIKEANSREFAQKGDFVIDLMPDQVNQQKGGTMRLGAYDCEIVPNTIMEKSYKSMKISERHRHRYEFNNDYRDILVKNGLIVSGVNPQKNIVETVEFNNHGQYFIGVQFHPEFKSRPTSPHPLFVAFVNAAKELKK
ncbi:MAG: CTP synthase [Clostridia bacterium]|nr:CTP synthase [Clostridia bacterium]